MLAGERSATPTIGMTIRSGSDGTAQRADRADKPSRRGAKNAAQRDRHGEQHRQCDRWEGDPHR